MTRFRLRLWLRCPADRGVLNERNIIPHKVMFSEPESYGSLLPAGTPPVELQPLQALIDLINSPEVTSVVLLGAGSVGFLPQLSSACAASLGPKLAASGMPLALMGGILSEVTPATMRLPGRDPRSSMNLLYDVPLAVADGSAGADPDTLSKLAPRVLLQLARHHGIPLLFVTNNVCNKLLRFEDSGDVVTSLGLGGLLEGVAKVWFSPRLAGKCVPFDWVALAAQQLYGRGGEALLKTEKRQLWVGRTDPSVMVLHDPRAPAEDTASNLEGCDMWGEAVDNVVDVDLALMKQMAQAMAKT